MQSVSETRTTNMTIDDLARRTGMTARNIRAHQSRGLLSPPDVRGRTGYYGPRHLSRIELIQGLQADGLNLEAIRRLLTGVGETHSAELDFARALRTPYEDEKPEIFDGHDLERLWSRPGRPFDRAATDRAVELGFLRRIGEGQVEVVSPRLMHSAIELADLGISPETALDVLEQVRGYARGISETFVNLFVESIWEPFDRAGRPDADWPKVREALDRMRPLASESLLSIFQTAMTEANEESFGRALWQQRASDALVMDDAEPEPDRTHADSASTL